MKKPFLAVILFITIYVSSVHGQTSNVDSLKYFVVLYSLGDSWDTTKQFYEQKYFEDHSNFLSNLRKEKKIEVGGRYSDKGMIILRVKNEAQAQEIMKGDISVKNKLFRYELYELDVFYDGCIDLP